MNTRTHRSDHLAALPIFAGLTTKELDTIDQLGSTIDLPVGTVVAREGSSSKEMMIVLDGRIAVERDGAPVAELGPGDVVGEVGVFGHHVRTATATVVSPARVLHFDQRAATDVLDAAPALARRLLAVVARRAGESDPDRPAP